VLVLMLAVSPSVADAAATSQGSVQYTPIPPPPCKNGRDAKGRKCSPVKHKNCTALRAVYPKGVARDAKSAASTGATVDAAQYKLHAGLDRDKDGIACES
jgi:hypothetical protein